MLTSSKKIEPGHIIYAADLDGPGEVISIMHEIAPMIGVIKLPPHIIMSCMLSDIVSAAHKLGLKLFLDLKFHDIPNTTYLAVKKAISLNINMLTLHTSAGIHTLEAAAKAKIEANSPIILLGVIRLTSEPIHNNQEMHLGALRAYNSGLQGAICAADDIATIRSAFPESITIVPGIRLDRTTADDQLRISTPRAAIDAGADYIVIGRPITNSTNRAATLAKIMSM